MASTAEESGEEARADWWPDIDETFTQREKWLFGGLFILFLASLIAASIIGVGNMMAGNVALASTYASFASGIATVLLVVLTGWYAVETRKMVHKTEQARKDEKEFREETRKRDLNKLRRALIEEIGSIDDLDALAEDYSIGHSFYEQITPSKVYETNANEIGALTTEEIEAVVRYYTIGEIVEDYLTLQRNLDSHIEGSLFERVYAAISFEWLLFRRERRKRTKATKERISDLADAQEIALQRLKSNLDKVRKDTGDS